LLSACSPRIIRATKNCTPGFEIFVLRDPSQIVVGGIENGPASRAGVHWGDDIVAVNGVDPRNKSVAELEALFSSQKPASMTLTIDRDGVTKIFSLQLEQATVVMRNNQHQLAKGNLIPLGVPQEWELSSCLLWRRYSSQSR
jgi:C-terminal processing protease CtpA/Prc